MSVLPAQVIRRLSQPGQYRGTADVLWDSEDRRLVAPFYERTRYRGKTFGLGPAGYDVRIAEDIWLWPFWGRLASTVEYFDVPRDVTFLLQDKSSWARRFVCALNTNAEPGWRGYLTLELVRLLPWPIRIRAGDPIANVLFIRLTQPTEQPYAGKYQDQEPGPQAARDDASDSDAAANWSLRGALRRVRRAF